MDVSVAGEKAAALDDKAEDPVIQPTSGAASKATATEDTDVYVAIDKVVAPEEEIPPTQPANSDALLSATQDDATTKMDTGGTDVGLRNEKVALSDGKEAPAIQPAGGEAPVTAATEAADMGVASETSVAPEDEEKIPATQLAYDVATSSPKKGKLTRGVDRYLRLERRY
ncbi:hypothetical protein BBJ28_00026600 [Nothophytophthora sp. Chile5]|nr:hypothetical protein BBJ28_00026600 [Nothophytophthora sp. Chile5]